MQLYKVMQNTDAS